MHPPRSCRSLSGGKAECDNGAVGTEITLSLGGIDIDSGKNRQYESHHWLFPPGSLTEIEYRYADDVSETRPGFETTLSEAHFRLCHLGYSHHETKTKFDTAMTRWNRTSETRLPLADLGNALASVDFANLTFEDLAPHDYEFRQLIGDLLVEWETEDLDLQDFVDELSVPLILRLVADRVENRSLPLRWHHQDVIDSGWVTLDDLTDSDRRTDTVNHIVLFGRLQDYSGVTSVKGFDRWLAGRGLPRLTVYTRIGRAHEMMTLPAAVRNKIHHPENPHNTLSDEELRESIELLLKIVKGLPTPLPGLA